MSTAGIVLLIILGIILVCIIGYLIYRSTHKATITNPNPEAMTSLAGASTGIELANQRAALQNPSLINNLSESILDNLTDYKYDDIAFDSARTGLSDSAAGNYGNFSPTDTDTCLGINPKDFAIGRQPHIVQSPQEIMAEYDVTQFMPVQGDDNGHFSIVNDLTARKVNNTQLIHPKTLQGLDTNSGAMRNASTDLRGDIFVPKAEVGPFMGSSIPQQNNFRGITLAGEC
jgi:hypothetical protein